MAFAKGPRTALLHWESDSHSAKIAMVAIVNVLRLNRSEGRSIHDVLNDGYRPRLEFDPTEEAKRRARALLA